MNNAKELILSKISIDYERDYLNTGSGFNDVADSFFLRLKNKRECRFFSYIMSCDSTLCEPTSNANTEDIIAIRKTLDLYVEAAIYGDSKVAEPAFAVNATISHVENDVLVCAPIKELFTYYDATGKQSASYEISQYSIVGNVAMVRIESKFGETEFSDMFTLAKNGKDWKIVSKVYYVK